MFVSEPVKGEMIVLWDMNNLGHRSAHAYQSLTTPSGAPSGHVFGTLTLISSFFKQRQITPDIPVCNIWCFDSFPKAKRDLFQETWGMSYKGDRGSNRFNPMPDILNVASYMCGTIAVTDGIECDTTMANLARILKGKRIFLVSNDRDMWTLADEVTVVSQRDIIDADKVWSEFGVRPEHVSLWKALFGDSSDCIPPILPRLPKKDFLPIILQGDGSPEPFLEQITKHPKWGSKFEGLRKKFMAQWDIVKLFTDDLPVMKTYSGDRVGLEKFCASFGIRKIAWDQLVGK